MAVIRLEGIQEGVDTIMVVTAPRMGDTHKLVETMEVFAIRLGVTFNPAEVMEEVVIPLEAIHKLLQAMEGAVIHSEVGTQEGTVGEEEVVVIVT